MLRNRLMAVSCALCLVAPASAAAQNAPPGNSGVDQYLETVPDAGGDRAPAGGRGEVAGPDDPGAAGGAEPADAPLPSGTAGRLEAAGAEGEALQQLVATPPSSRSPGVRTSTRTARRPADDGSAQGGGGEKNTGPAPGEGRVKALPSVSSALTATGLTGSGEGGMGLLLPALLAVTTLGTVALALRRRSL